MMVRSIPEVFTLNAERTPDRLCLRFEGEEWTYERLRKRAESFAAALRTWGLRPGDRVALFLGNHPDFLAAYLGTHLAGGVVVPVNTQYRKVELRHIFGDAGVRLCMTDGERGPELDGVRGELPELETVIEAGGELQGFLDAGEPYESRLPDAEDLAVIAYTSGTTGRSKGAMLLHRNLVANAEAVCAAWRWTAEDRLLLTLPLFHTHGLMVGALVRDDPGLTAKRVAEFCREGLANYKKPRQVAFVDALPRNALGKVLKHEVRRELIEAEE
jgi:malonyl-CoA/methylmalonyl-CoA synthetase